jgi:hypothetical protein
VLDVQVPKVNEGRRLVMSDGFSLSDRIAMRRMQWLPFRGREWLGGEEWGPEEWIPPDRGPIRWLMRRFGVVS